MKTFELTYNGKSYQVDEQGYLLEARDWDEDFAAGTADQVGIRDGLTDQHWKVIHFIRNSFDEIGACPLVYVACRKNEIGLGNLNVLFPTGYLRGACRLAGVSYREAYLRHLWLEENFAHLAKVYQSKTYLTDAKGFLLNPSDWDESFAIHKAYEMKMPDYLTPRHWQIIRYVRDRFLATGDVPSVYETCEVHHLDLEELERLFPDGYHRGAIKIAGLRVR